MRCCGIDVSRWIGVDIRDPTSNNANKKHKKLETDLNGLGGLTGYFAPQCDATGGESHGACIIYCHSPPHFDISVGLSDAISRKFANAQLIPKTLLAPATDIATRSDAMYPVNPLNPPNPL